MKERVTYWIKIYGVVQGVGFRPFIKSLATELAVVGRVKNEEGNVLILATGSECQITLFVERMKTSPPFGASIDRLETIKIPTVSFQDFRILDSNEKLNIKCRALDGKAKKTTPYIHVGVDLPLCINCERELYDRTNRRYHHPLISCVQCGPRYSIIKNLPYDRPSTTMDAYSLCEECGKEYVGEATGASHLRIHAQTISCHKCGPQLMFSIDGKMMEQGENALHEAITVLQAGGVIAVKGIGGYHFVCRPDCEAAVNKLRQLKQRDRKPFAVMFRSVNELSKYCTVSEREERELLSIARPIVLLLRKETEFVTKNIDPEVYKDSLFLGAFLPYTGTQCLLLDGCGPLVFTSANITDEPIIGEDDDILELASKLDGILYHTREILVPMDDSVVQVVAGRRQILRRARGYVPMAISISEKQGEWFAAGGDLKSVFGFYRNGEAFLSPYIGDLEQEGNSMRYAFHREHMKRLFQFEPNAFVVDAHPGYYSYRMTLALYENLKPQKEAVTFQKVQHHHAHIGSVMAEHQIHEVIGVAFDGTGLGEDNAVWGSEFFLCKEGSYHRRGHLIYVPVVGYDNAAKNASVMAMCHLYAADIVLDTQEYHLLAAAIKAQMNTHNCSSMGRLFDAVTAILKLCFYNGYEGECAMALERAARAGIKDPRIKLPVKIINVNGIDCIDQSVVIRALYTGMQENRTVSDLALAFHYWVVEVILIMCRRLKKESGLTKVALSGGVFVNRIVLENTIKVLEEEGFHVLINEKVPCGDGGIALGQLYISQWRKS